MEIKGNIFSFEKEKFIKGKIIINNEIITDIIEEENDSNLYIMPGLINSHVHIESSMVSPLEFSKLAVKHGTVGIITDPHEITNVLGTKGLDYMIDNAKKTKLKIFFGVPSCVPATNFETSGAILNSKLVDEYLNKKEFVALSEMMNYPGVIFDDEEVHKKLKSAQKYNKPIDGHAPGLSGEDLKKYVNSGISTDHECTNVNEALEKIKLGMYVQIREGSAAKDFEALHSLIDSKPDNIMLCTDDTHPDDLVKGHINSIVKKALNKGHNIFNIMKAVNLNPVKHYKLDVGTLKKGDKADFIIVDNLKDFNILSTFINGEEIYKNGEILINNNSHDEINNFNISKINISDIEIENIENKKINVIVCKDGDLITKKSVEIPKIVNNKIVSDIDNDILKIVVLNRYKQSKPAVGFIKNIGIKNGAIAQTIAHDSHNIIAVGTSDEDIVKVINQLIENKGGMAVFNGKTMETLKLEIAGLMTNKSVAEIGSKYEKLNEMVRDMGSELHAPFMTLAFMALLVIPEIKLGDKGLFDATKFEFMNLFE